MEVVLEVLKTYGLAAAICVAALFASAYAIRALWKQVQDLQKQLVELRVEHERKLSEQKLLHETRLQEQKLDVEKDAHAAALAQSDRIEKLSLEHSATLARSQGNASERARLLADRVDELQDRRVKEAHESAEKMASYVQHIDKLVMKLDAVAEVLMTGRGGGRRL